MTSTSNRTIDPAQKKLTLGGPPRVGPHAVADTESVAPRDEAQLTIPGADVRPARGAGGAAGGRGRGKKARHRIRSRHERAGRQAGVPIRAISLSLPATVATEWRTFSQRVKRSLVDVMLDAIVANKDRLHEIVRTHQSAVRSGRQPVSDGLFLRTADAGSGLLRGPGGMPLAVDEVDDLGNGQDDEDRPEDPFVTVPLRMLSTNIDTLDQLVYESAADSRSQFVLAVLTAYLTDKRVTAKADPSRGVPMLS